MYLFLAALGLCGCTRAFSSGGRRGCCLIVAHGLLTAGASPVAEHRRWSRASVVGAHALSCPTARGLFLDPGLNLCLLLWQVDS